MLKKDITYDDLNGETVTEEFHFHFSKLEVVEMMELDELEAKIKKLTETEDAKEAYGVFKDLILRSVGRKSEDGRRFVKNQEIRDDFASSPALDELIFEFLNNPALGAQFIEKTLPAKLVAEAKAAQAKNPSDAEVKKMVQDAAVREGILEDTPQELQVQADPKDTSKKFEDYSEKELLEMSQEKFKALVGTTNPREMTREQLQVAMVRKMQG